MTPGPGKLKGMEMGWYSASAQCDVCAREWVATYPDVCERLECPGCGHMTRAPHLVEQLPDERDERKEPWQQ